MKAKRPKYGNHKVWCDGIKFDSARERDRYLYLLAAQERGEIKNLELQPKYELMPAVYDVAYVKLKTKTKEVRKLVQRPVFYIGDFRYNKVRAINPLDKVVEDVKISEHLIPKEFKLKEKMLFFRYRIKIRKVFKPTEEI